MMRLALEGFKSQVKTKEITMPAQKSNPQKPDLNSLLRTKAFINGTWHAGKSKKTFPVANPADGATLAHVADCDAGDAKAAIKAAVAAFEPWKAMLPKARADILKAWYRLIIDRADDLAALLSAEQGKPLAEAKGEILYGASFVEWFGEEARRIYGRTVPPFKKGARVVVTREPVGVCAAITPWNFPNSMITRKVAPALAAGCTVVLKPAEDTPLSALALAELADQAGFPQGVFNVVPTSRARLVGEILCTHPDIRKLSFTGSTGVGRILMAQCAPTLKRLSMELGGNAPFIVFDDADIEAAIQGAISSKFRNSGQTCVCANRFFIQEKIYKVFVTKFKTAILALKVGAAFEKGAVIGPLINRSGLEKVETMVRDARVKGGQVTLGGKPHKKAGLFYEPTLIEGATPGMRLYREEIFGPVAPVFPFKTEKEAVSLANQVDQGLAAYVYTSDLGRAMRLSEALEYGMVGINEGIISSEVAPFGGVKQSGFGREGALEGLEEYTQVKYTLFGGL
jgi:succinate-semialdehyde dehydrogenase/glutarate-semialdehyde dehydrogenase